MLRKVKDDLLSVIPTNWTDSLLTGKDRVVGEPPYSCQDIERLLNTIRKRLKEKLNKLNSKNVMDMKNYGVIGNWCTGENHIFVRAAGSANEPMPEGIVCSCGKTSSHLEACKECGSLINKPIVINKTEKG